MTEYRGLLCIVTYQWPGIIIMLEFGTWINFSKLSIRASVCYQIEIFFENRQILIILILVIV